MSGTLGPREQRQTYAQPVGVADPTRDLMAAAGAARQTSNQVAGVLSGLGEAAMGEAKKEARATATAEAWAEPLVRDAEGNLQAPNLRQHFLLGEGERARRAVLATRYGAEFVSQNQDALIGLRTANPDPDAFRQAAQAHVEGVLSKLPEAVRPMVGEGMAREVGRHAASMQAERLEHERKETLAAADANLANLQRDYMATLRGGAAGGPGAAAAGPAGTDIRTQIEGQLQGLVAARLITPAAAQERLRTVTEIMPLQARLMAETTRQDPTAAKATVQALLDGPGTPGWRPEWNTLRPDEARDLARIVEASASHRRAEQLHARSEGQIAAQTQSARLSVEVGDLARQAASPAGLSEAQERRRLEVEAELRRLAPVTRSTLPASLIGSLAEADERGTARRGQETLNRDAIGRAQELLRTQDNQADEVPASGRLALRLAGQPLSVQATIYAREAQEAAERVRATAAQEGPVRSVLAALSGGTRAENNGANQAVVLGLLQGQDPLGAPAQPLLVNAAAGGVVPQPLVTAGANLLRPGASGEQLQSFAGLHEAMMRDPRARDRWASALGDELVRAYSGMSSRMQGWQADRPGAAQELEVIRSAAGRVARGESVVEDVRASLGRTRDNQDQVIAEARAEAAARYSGSAEMPGPMQRDFARNLLEGIGAGLDRQTAGDLAMLSLTRQGWAVSELGTGPTPPMLPRGQTDAARSELGIDALQAQRWVKDAPDRFVAPFGAGGEIGTRWIRERLGDIATEARLPGGRGRYEPGVNLLLQPATEPGAPRSVTGGPTYQVLFQEPTGIWNYVRDGDSARPRFIDVAAEAETHRRRWTETTGGDLDAELARQARNADRRRSVLRWVDPTGTNPIMGTITRGLLP